MALEALKQIAEIGHHEIPQEKEPEENIPKTKWLVFYIGEKKYAVCGNQVVNVLKNVKLYNFPFAPHFIDGIINNHNKIGAVVNYKKLIDEASDISELNLYIVLKTDSDDISLRVTSVDDFYQIPDEDYSSEQTLRQDDGSLSFIQGRLKFNEAVIPVLNIQAINEIVIESCKKGMH